MPPVEPRVIVINNPQLSLAEQGGQGRHQRGHRRGQQQNQRQHGAGQQGASRQPNRGQSTASYHVLQDQRGQPSRMNQRSGQQGTRTQNPGHGAKQAGMKASRALGKGTRKAGKLGQKASYGLGKLGRKLQKAGRAVTRNAKYGYRKEKEQEAMRKAGKR